MCGRFTLTMSFEELVEKFLIDEWVDEWGPRFNVAPSQAVLSLITGKGQRMAGPIRWGLIPSWVNDRSKWKPLINARSETLEEKSSFKHLLNKRRTAILADSFFEWKRKDGEKQPYRFMMKDKEPFAFAGLWDKQTNGNSAAVSSTIITTSANDLVQPVHDRMPVILKGEENINKWISTADYTFNEVKELLVPFPSEFMTKYKVSQEVNSTRNDFESCVKPLENLS
ncbi:SOS response-associated peptidase [Rossellomorea vietnamensis]|uniref:Abasic site processing protein n=1 Tax=Rossellomorea vietnamensis TaxID=218284 RepID=A0A5D4KGY7_9BACI|nr:SOS response-associated peptidase [Rossellomorea vietnamensis]TYR76554.1 SOS response-associated peptidase [Rossellomorea vietnamensis]